MAEVEQESQQSEVAPLQFALNFRSNHHHHDESQQSEGAPLQFALNFCSNHHHHEEEQTNTNINTSNRNKRGKAVLEEEEEETNSNRDPLLVFGSDILMMILNHLDARSVALSLLVSLGWHGVASSDKLWSKKCEELWLGKAHIPRSSMTRGISKLEAYSISVKDSKRTRIMKEDLCDHSWEFRFKKSAPPYWLNLDPSWKGTGPPMMRYFHPNGSQTADPNDPVWGGHECTFSIVTSFVGEGSIREHYVRINRWPRMTVSRKQDWSWEMANQIYWYSSIPDADKRGGTGPVFPIW